jgi:hypothetical protein
MDLQVVDNFFEDPDRVVEVAKHLQWFYWDHHPARGIATGKYAGIRSNELHLENPDFFNYASNKIAATIYDFSKMNKCTWRCSMYFSLVSARDKPGKDSPVKIIHSDSGVGKSGLIFLSKRINRGAGTSFYNSNYKKIKEAKNRYNRLISYEGKVPHGTSKYVDNRLTLLFFFKDVVYHYA